MDQHTFSSRFKAYLQHSRLIVCISILTLFSGIYLFESPYSFPRGVIITINQGDTLATVSHKLKDSHIIHSATLFQDLVIVFEGEHKALAGDYYFGTPENIITIAGRITHGTYDLTPIKTTIPEGSTVDQIATILGSKFSRFDASAFITLAEDKEGYLFPDTYFFMPNVTAEQVIQVMSQTYDQKVSPLRNDIKNSGHIEKEIITLASILEEEAKTAKDWQIIAGIMWKRIDLGMPLQVDATLGFVTGKGSSELTLSDLHLNSPYNTYTNKGLPPTPISNPGLVTIQAALTPTTTPYFFYLSDKKGIIHYAKTLEEHDVNIDRYLR